MIPSKEEAYKIISALIERFEEQLPSYKQTTYNETLTRRDFINSTIFNLKIEFQKLHVKYDEIVYFKEFLMDVVSKFEALEGHYSYLGSFLGNILKDNFLQYYTLNYDDLIIKSLDSYNNNVTNFNLWKHLIVKVLTAQNLWIMQN